MEAQPAEERLSPADFENTIANLHRRRATATRAKRSQYAGKGDVLGNFRRRAQTLGTTPEQVIVSDLSKHIDAIAKAANEGKLTNEWETADGAEGYGQKIADAITYLELLAGRASELAR